MKLTNLKIEQLNERLNSHKHEASSIEAKLQQEYNKLFDADKILEQDLKNAESASMYQAEEDGIYSWYRMKSDLSMFEQYPELKNYFELYVSERGLRIDWENQCLMNFHGDDCLVIQDDTRHDNGVWQGHKLIIAEKEYKTDDGEIDVEKRNAMIEAHMEKTGYFPGVFRITQYGDVYFVNTQKKK